MLQTVADDRIRMYNLRDWNVLGHELCAAVSKVDGVRGAATLDARGTVCAMYHINAVWLPYDLIIQHQHSYHNSCLVVWELICFYVQ